MLAAADFSRSRSSSAVAAGLIAESLIWASSPLTALTGSWKQPTEIAAKRARDQLIRLQPCAGRRGRPHHRRGRAPAHARGVRGLRVPALLRGEPARDDPPRSLRWPAPGLAAPARSRAAPGSRSRRGALRARGDPRQVL